jgi:2-polyprenyl-3-methyl-5-hydroxy-6-metoxy-1,4-benzoquinol methylase
VPICNDLEAAENPVRRLRRLSDASIDAKTKWLRLAVALSHSHSRLEADMNAVVQKLNYDYSFDPDGDHSGANILRMVKMGSKVLEIGAGPGSITRPLKELNDCDIVALEVNPQYIERLQTFCSRVVPADLNNHSWAGKLFAQERFDFVVIADVLEHLAEPLQTLQQATTVLKPDGAVVVSLPHIGHNAIIACLLDYDFAYGEWGLLDRTHVRFFCIKNMMRLVQEAGLKIVDVRFVVKTPEKTEFADRWAALPKQTREMLATNKYGYIYQVVFKAVRQSAPGEAIDIEKIDVPRPKYKPRLFGSKRLGKIATAVGLKV